RRERHNLQRAEPGGGTQYLFHGPRAFEAELLGAGQIGGEGPGSKLPSGYRCWIEIAKRTVRP
ncbi:MAG: hypothetical protein ABR922_17890, partial [Streptosporangiaceae bacterium]